jgi:beta-lactamase regulating signal transducer with metallopeptidase domain
MIRALSPAEREVLLAHERAHAAGFHFLFTVAARLAAAANPLLRPVSAAVAYSVERWADEHAAAATGDRPLTARAVARAALAAKASPPAPRAPEPAHAAPGPPAAYWSPADRSSAAGPSVAVLTAVAPPAARPAERPVRYPSRHPGPVPRRVAALLSPPPRRRLLLMAAAALLVLIAGASALEAAHDLHALLEYARGTT